MQCILLSCACFKCRCCALCWIEASYLSADDDTWLSSAAFTALFSFVAFTAVIFFPAYYNKGGSSDRPVWPMLFPVGCLFSLPCLFPFLRRQILFFTGVDDAAGGGSSTPLTRRKTTSSLHARSQGASTPRRKNMRKEPSQDIYSTTKNYGHEHNCAFLVERGLSRARSRIIAVTI